jgi:hypothetical protein
MAPGFTQPVIEIIGKARPASKADNLTAIYKYDPTV